MKKYKKCGNCGELFTVPPEPRYNATKYCCKFCAEQAHSRQKREYEQRCKEAGIIGKKYLGNSNVKEHANNDFEKEYQTILNELVRLKLRKSK